ncbi:lytic transglycosylase domain-containing protein [Sphingomonas aquatilis]|nr:lytic transglycosylase domain-containing protein [Sphingomonas aquatilis]
MCRARRSAASSPIRGREVLAPVSPAFAPQTAFDAVIQQESGGRAGVVGPQTPYGRALGVAQLLPATARSMADKLGLPYREDLLTAKTPLAADYQRTLGEAYFNEGLARTGNLPDALRYYHGGPNRRLWGPKTQQYARDVLGRMGS